VFYASVFVLFLLAIVACILAFAALDELFDIIKVFFCWDHLIGKLHFRVVDADGSR
jgi:hypothetical protein